MPHLPEASHVFIDVRQMMNLKRKNSWKWFSSKACLMRRIQLYNLNLNLNLQWYTSRCFSILLDFIIIPYRQLIVRLCILSVLENNVSNEPFMTRDYTLVNNSTLICLLCLMRPSRMS